MHLLAHRQKPHREQREFRRPLRGTPLSEVNVKIMIQIDGADVVSQSLPSGATDNTSQARLSESSAVPDALQQLYAKAAASGAIDAGPAPEEHSGSTRGVAPSRYIGPAST